MYISYINGKPENTKEIDKFLSKIAEQETVSFISLYEDTVIFNSNSDNFQITLLSNTEKGFNLNKSFNRIGVLITDTNNQEIYEALLQLTNIRKFEGEILNDK
jgi:hypothetical protein